MLDLKKCWHTTDWRTGEIKFFNSFESAEKFMDESGVPELFSDPESVA